MTCKPIIGLDGYFLKERYKGQLLAIVGGDPNDQMLPIAFVIMEDKLKDS